MKTLCFLIFLLLTISVDFFGQNTQILIYQINVNREIDPTSRLYLSKGLEEVRQKRADAVLLHLNTYGGALVDADSMRSAILYSSIPVYVFIDNNAASAGALISIACKKIYMRPGANIGAATVVDQRGEPMTDKYQSYMRATIRATAETHGRDTVITGMDTVYRWIRDPQIAEAMVDERIVVPNISDSGKILTLTAQEALKVGYCDGIAETSDEVVTKYLGYTEYKLIKYNPPWYDNLKGFLMNPAFQAILIMIIMAGIYFELQTPGVVFPGIAAVAAAVLYFAPLYVDGLVQYWEIILFIIGIILILLEIFVVPGFGITGISGIVCTISGLVLALLANDNLSFRGVGAADMSRSVLTVLSGFLLGFLAMLYISSRIGQKGVLRRVALLADLEHSMSVNVNDRTLVGRTGEALTVLRPSGKVIIDHEMYDAVSNIGFIEKGESIKVVRFENAQLYVEIDKK